MSTATLAQLFSLESNTLFFSEISVCLRGRNVSSLISPARYFAPKDPSETRLYRADFSAFLSQDATMLPVVVTVSGAVKVSQKQGYASVLVAISGGNDNTLAVVDFLVTLSDGQVISREALLPIIQLVGLVPVIPPPPTPNLEGDPLSNLALGDPLSNQPIGAPGGGTTTAILADAMGNTPVDPAGNRVLLP